MQQPVMMAYNDCCNLGCAFVTTFYQLFDTDRSSLRPLYHAEAMLSFEDQQVQGSDAIVEKLVNLPFKQIKHIVTKIDCQPTTDGGVLILVCGQLKTDNDPIHGFSELFCLKPFNSNYSLFHNIFRLSLHNVPATS